MPAAFANPHSGLTATLARASAGGRAGTLAPTADPAPGLSPGIPLAWKAGRPARLIPAQPRPPARVKTPR
jgi:hypothetical protein